MTRSGQGASGAYLAGGFSQYSGYGGECKKYCTKFMSGGGNMQISTWIFALSRCWTHLLDIFGTWKWDKKSITHWDLLFNFDPTALSCLLRIQVTSYNKAFILWIFGPWIDVKSNSIPRVKIRLTPMLCMDKGKSVSLLTQQKLLLP